MTHHQTNNREEPIEEIENLINSNQPTIDDYYGTPLQGNCEVDEQLSEIVLTTKNPQNTQMYNNSPNANNSNIPQENESKTSNGLGESTLAGSNQKVTKKKTIFDGWFALIILIHAVIIIVFVSWLIGVKISDTKSQSVRAKISIDKLKNFEYSPSSCGDSYPEILFQLDSQINLTSTAKTGRAKIKKLSCLLGVYNNTLLINTLQITKLSYQNEERSQETLYFYKPEQIDLESQNGSSLLVHPFALDIFLDPQVFKQKKLANVIIECNIELTTGLLWKKNVSLNEKLILQLDVSKFCENNKCDDCK
ncbi:hypothetical protein M0813_18283 [Anaeramoeba flamelloides]|uniref:Late embryogenesis abundant protein LEA-2 subgroup domain-containing protein n=1 Tax=Anaeramoeba flamelloides TaxID=1746091 RepID=A0ABQ8YTA3_9EUKA|nr:hypothetical protein M0813_18283 [Anaeramoeba flamelloides]